MTADFTGAHRPPPPDHAQGRDRAEQAAHYLRQLLRQIKGVRVLTQGVRIVLLTPAPATDLAAALARAGANVEVEGRWEGTLAAEVGWWHRRTQLRSLAEGIDNFLSHRPLRTIDPDSFIRIPTDLPRRRVDSISSSSASKETK